MKCICLSDCNSPGMDKIYYFVSQTTKRLQAASCHSLDNPTIFNDDSVEVSPEKFEEEDDGDFFEDEPPELVEGKNDVDEEEDGDDDDCCLTQGRGKSLCSKFCHAG